MVSPLDIRPLRSSDIAAAVRLSTQAGWNQLDADWRRLIHLWPGQCLGGWRDERLVATATLASYGGRVGWVGMVLVDEACRGQGIGGTLMDAILDTGRRAGIDLLGLDATDLGQPVYLRRGFIAGTPVDRWHSRQRTTQAELLPTAEPSDWSGILELDRASCGADRGPLLRELAGEEGAAVHVVGGSSLRGFGFARQGRVAGHLGPVVATDEAAASRLVGSLLAGFPVDHPVFLDAPRTPVVESVLGGHGFRVARRLLRMTRPASERPALMGLNTWAIAGFELG